MMFLLVECFNGGSYKVGIVTGETPEAAAKKLGATIEGRMTKSDSLGAYYLKTEPQGPAYILEHWAELTTLPRREIQ